MVGSPEVTVLIPTRSRWELLSRNALPSALRQECVHLEVIVVDDGSTDDTPARLAEIDEPRLRVIRQEVSRGVARARNRGIAEARGAWLAFLDDDDIWSPRKLRMQLDAAAAQNTSFVYCGSVFLDERRHVVRVDPAPEPDDLLFQLLKEDVVPGGTSGAIATAELVRRVGGFDEQLSVLADWDLWIRLATVSRAAACRELLVGYLEHPQNMHVAITPDACLREFEHVARKHRAARLACGVDPDRDSFTQWLVDEHRRAGRRLHAARLYLRAAYEQRNVANLLRAAGILLGERIMRLGSRASASLGEPRPVSEARITEPAWLDLYR